MPLILIALISLVVASLAAAAYVVVLERGRRAIVTRSAEVSLGAQASPARGRNESISEIAARRVAAMVPQSWTSGDKTADSLTQAGYDADTAPLVYASARVVLLIALPLVAFFIAPKKSIMDIALYVVSAGIIALIIPYYWLVRSVRLRQERIRRSLPDALDLLVVCIEAGISLDAAILRVSREFGSVHEELAEELLIVNRKSNAGMPRADALRGLWTRTGVEEIRSLVSHIVQGEKWGTSSGKVLRVYSDALRRKRRQTAEKKAATAPVKMLLPLGLFIFPAMFVVILGPVAMTFMKLFK